MSARDDIFSAIRARRAKRIPKPPSYRPPAPDNLVQAFAERARLADAEVRFINGEADVPQAAAELLRARNMAAIVHVPPSASVLPWMSAPGLTFEHTTPGADDAAIAIAAFGIAETGTLAYPARADSPASWHFRAGFEIAVVRAETILSHMEDVIAQLKSGDLPSTVNFVTGPSRTGDIEQTLELGAHGPKALAVLIVLR
ncbi:MAG TPA: LUD domain-containing protein [Rhizomicrobium sp.]|jgi:L-lactate dehydrogenase complex protein LldG|nr:LUD domain-containing protein [Rhizomicrobium sp.]